MLKRLKSYTYDVTTAVMSGWNECNYHALEAVRCRMYLHTTGEKSIYLVTTFVGQEQTSHAVYGMAYVQ